MSKNMINCGQEFMNIIMLIRPPKLSVLKVTKGSLMNRWSTIQLYTNKYSGCLAKIESLHQSGMTEKNKVHLIILKVVLMHQFVLIIEDITYFYLLIF